MINHPTELPWDYSVDIYAAGLVMYEMTLGSGIIPPKCPPAKTLALLHAFFGPLPNHLAKHAASKSTEVPFTKVNRTVINASMFQTTELDFKGMGISGSDIQATMVMHKFKSFHVTNERGGAPLIDLMDKMLRLGSLHLDRRPLGYADGESVGVINLWHRRAGSGLPFEVGDGVSRSESGRSRRQ